MAKILSIETAAEGCSVAIHRDGQLIGSKGQFEVRSAAETLTILIQELLDELGYTFQMLDALAVSKGPGSYTGLRIGVSTAKGICYATDLPLLSVNTLDAMAEDPEINGFDGLLCPMLDARRMEVYCKLYRKGEVLLDTQALILNEASFSHFLEQEKILFYGSGAVKFRSITSHNTSCFTEKPVYPKADNMGKIAEQKFTNGKFENLVEFEPYYLKEFMMTTPKANKKVVA